MAEVRRHNDVGEFKAMYGDIIFVRHDCLRCIELMCKFETSKCGVGGEEFEVLDEG